MRALQMHTKCEKQHRIIELEQKKKKKLNSKQTQLPLCATRCSVCLVYENISIRLDYLIHLQILFRL